MGQSTEGDAVLRSQRIDVLMREYGFVASLIPMYRTFQMQSVGFAIALYAAEISLLGVSVDNSARLSRLLEYCVALMPSVVALLVMSFGVIELRVRRANLYIVESLRPMVSTLLDADADASLQYLGFGVGAPQHLSPFERRMSSSVVSILIMAGPALVGALWMMSSTTYGAVSSVPVAGTGAAVLLVASAFAVHVSARRPPMVATPKEEPELAA